MKRVSLYLVVVALGALLCTGVALGQVDGESTGGTTGGATDSSAPLEGEPVAVEGDAQVNGGDVLTIEGSYSVAGDARITLVDEDETVGTLSNGENAQFEAGDEKLTIKVTDDPTGVVGGNGVLNTEGLTVESSEGVEANETTAGGTTERSTEESTDEPEEPQEEPQPESEQEPEEQPGGTTVTEVAAPETPEEDEAAATTVFITEEDTHEETADGPTAQAGTTAPEDTEESAPEESAPEESEPEESTEEDKPTPVIEEATPIAQEDNEEDNSGPVFVADPAKKPVLPDTGGPSLVVPATLIGLAILVVGCLVRRGS